MSFILKVASVIGPHTDRDQAATLHLTWKKHRLAVTLCWLLVRYIRWINKHTVHASLLSSVIVSVVHREFSSGGTGLSPVLSLIPSLSFFSLVSLSAFSGSETHQHCKHQFIILLCFTGVTFLSLNPPIPVSLSKFITLNHLHGDEPFNLTQNQTLTSRTAC